MITNQTITSLLRKTPIISVFLHRLNARQEEIIHLLRKTAIFADLSESELVGLLHLLHERSFTQGEMIFKEGEPGLGLYVILKGEVEVKKATADGKSRIARLGHGEVFGEVSFLDGGNRSATVIATVKTTLIGFYRTELFHLLDRRPALASKILLALARQIGIRMRAMLQLIQS